MKKFFLLFCIFFISAVNCFSFEQKFVPNDGSLTVGDKAVLSVNASGLSLDTVDREKLNAVNFGDFELTDVKNNPEGGIDLILSSYKAGKAELLSADIYYTSNGQTQFVKTDALPVEIRSVMDPQNPGRDIADIKGILAAHHSAKWFIKVILTVLLILALLFFIIRYIIKKQKHKPTKEEIILAIPPKEYAASQLDELKKLNLIEKGQIKDYYDRLSDILRYYVSRVYKIDGMEKTTKELFSLLKDKIPAEVNRELKNYLINCDFVKFAKLIPSESEADKDFEQAKDFVEKL